MEFIIQDYSEIGKDKIAMTAEEWDSVCELDNDGTGSSLSSVYAYLHCLPM